MDRIIGGEVAGIVEERVPVRSYTNLVALRTLVKSFDENRFPRSRLIGYYRAHARFWGEHQCPESIADMHVLHCDEFILAAVKKPGQLAQPDRTGDLDLLRQGKEWLSTEEGEAPFLGLVHRLDRPTSGVMIFARSSDAARRLSEQFRERTVEKQYLALVEGTFRGVGTWSDYIAKLGRTPQLVSPDHPEGTFAELDWQALSRRQGRTLLRVQLHTGRPHQIRLQAADRGAPIVGDTRYGASTSISGAGIALHHAVLRVDHPGKARRVTFVASLPALWEPLLSPEMRRAVDQVLSRATPGAEK